MDKKNCDICGKSFRGNDPLVDNEGRAFHKKCAPKVDWEEMKNAVGKLMAHDGITGVLVGPPLDPGTRVKTTESKTPDHEWMPEALASRKWGVLGTIIKHHDSHGLCYDVKHDDGTVGCYDPSELEVWKDRYVGATRDELAAHASEGWDLANTRTDQLRQAVEALRGAEFVIEAWARRLGADWQNNVNLKELIKVLSWGKTMFPEEDERLDEMHKGGGK